MEEAN